jgi:hypothetical protein
MVSAAKYLFHCRLGEHALSRALQTPLPDVREHPRINIDDIHSFNAGLPAKGSSSTGKVRQTSLSKQPMSKLLTVLTSARPRAM